MLKAMDSQKQGFIDAIAVIKFLEKYSRVYAQDFSLELKYMANFLEFKLTRPTRTFFESNSTLRANQRLLEIDVMNTLNKCFDLPLSIGTTIFNQLRAKNQNSTLVDLCALIDDYRVVKPSTEAPK